MEKQRNRRLRTISVESAGDFNMFNCAQISLAQSAYINQV